MERRLYFERLCYGCWHLALRFGNRTGFVLQAGYRRILERSVWLANADTTLRLILLAHGLKNKIAGHLDNPLI